MLAAAGLSATWFFRKAQLLAVFDDFDTLILLIPLQMMFVGWRPELIVVVVLIVALFVAAYRWLHILKLPSNVASLLVYSIGILLASLSVEHFFHIKLGVLLPAFAFGAILYNPNSSNHNKKQTNHKGSILTERIIKALFMFLVGCSMPKIGLGQVSLWILFVHVAALTILSNLGKCFLFFCYRKEADNKNRAALSIAMFPRGEVGAGVLLIAMGYGIGGLGVSLAALSLALNLILTGLFIFVVIRLIQQ